MYFLLCLSIIFQHSLSIVKIQKWSFLTRPRYCVLPIEVWMLWFVENQKSVMAKLMVLGILLVPRGNLTHKQQSHCNNLWTSRYPFAAAYSVNGCIIWQRRGAPWTSCKFIICWHTETNKHPYSHSHVQPMAIHLPPFFMFFECGKRIEPRTWQC